LTSSWALVGFLEKQRIRVSVFLFCAFLQSGDFGRLSQLEFEARWRWAGRESYETEIDEAVRLLRF
jgi:hypothetical protein